MKRSNFLRASNVWYDPSPFPHFLAESLLDDSIEGELLQWFKLTSEWKKVATDFYEQFEFSLLDVSPPEGLQTLLDEKQIGEIETLFARYFDISRLILVDITAHKHNDGQSIGIHNDFIEGEETHRLVVQINEKWTSSNGGFQMLFNSDNAEDVAKIIRPISNSAMGFEISERSLHAVSKIVGFNRYSLVYTFKG